VKGESIGHGRRGRWRRMSNVLKGLRMLEVMGHHAMLWRGVRVARRSTLLILVVFIIAVLLVHKVLGAFMLVCAAILRDLSVRCSFSATLYPGWGVVHTYW
jgi:hypothetical protein